jgi:hypothetical protein
MRELPVFLFVKDGHALAAPAAVLDRIEDIGGKKCLWLRNMEKGIYVDEVLDFQPLPLELLHPLPLYIRDSLGKEYPLWSSKTIWGIVNLGNRLFPIVDLEAIAEDLEHEGP